MNINKQSLRSSTHLRRCRRCRCCAHFTWEPFIALRTLEWGSQYAEHKSSDQLKLLQVANLNRARESFAWFFKDLLLGIVNRFYLQISIFNL